MEEIKLKELGDIITGNTPSKKEVSLWSSKDIPFIKPDLISDNEISEIVDADEYISEKARSKARIVTGNSIFVTCIGSIGKIGITSSGEYAFNQQINAIVPNDKVDTKYLAYALLHAKPKLETVANAPVVPIINKSQFGDFSICIETDINIQHKIVNHLDLLRNIIDKRKTELRQFDDLIKARFVELFGDPLLNEKGWTTKPLLDMGNCKNGMNFRYDDSGVEINCLGVGDFKDYTVIENTGLLPVISLNEMPSDEYLLKNDDIVFVRSNGNKALVGRSVAVYPHDTPTTFSGFCIRYRKHDDSITVPYLLRVLKSDSMRLKMAGRGANIQNLNQQILGTLIIPVPPIELQNQFSDFSKQVDKSKSVVQKSLDEAQMLFDSLMQKYFG